MSIRSALLRFALPAVAVIVAGPAAAQPPAGAAIFAQNCAACHQSRGQGIPGAFPALAGNKFVVGDPRAVALTVLNGRGGMPAFRDVLTDQELVAVLGFVRSSWGNHAPPITAKAFADARTGAKAAANRPMPGH